MALDLKKLRKKHKEIKTGGGDDLILYSNKLPEELDIRLMPPTEEMAGVYFVEQHGWWVDGHFHAVASSFGGTDFIEEEIDAAKAANDPELNALLEKTKQVGSGKMKVVKRETRYLVGILVLNVPDEDDGEVTVKDDMVKVLVAKPSLLKQINKTVTHKLYQNGTPDGICDREKGFNLVIGKSGAGLDTEYSAQGYLQPMEMDEKYYKAPKYLDLLKFAKGGLKSEAATRSIIRNYLYGEDIIEDPKKDESEAITKTVTKAKTTTAKKAKTGNGRPSKVTKKNKAVEAEGTVSKSLLDDVESELEDID